MMTALLIFHLLVTIGLVSMVLLQRSEGGGLGIGGGGGGGGFMTTRGTANALTRATVTLAVLFFATSISLSILAGAQRGGAGGTGSVTDSIPATQPDPFAAPAEVPVEVPAESPDDGLPEVPVGD
jgi:preprotein translocase subunit SecG